MMSFDTGRTFDVTFQRDDWLQMIFDLLNLSAISIFNRRRVGYVRAPRWSGTDVFDLLIKQDELNDEKNDMLPN